MELGKLESVTDEEKTNIEKEWSSDRSFFIPLDSHIDHR